VKDLPLLHDLVAALAAALLQVVRTFPVFVKHVVLAFRLFAAARDAVPRDESAALVPAYGLAVEPACWIVSRLDRPLWPS
jgi:hypothetical protein